ncbi:anti-sigma factor [Pseudonocardia saturnea]
MWHPDPDQLALAALPAERRDLDVEAHLRGCPLCRGHVESLRRTVDLAVSGRAGADDESPPERIWTAITGELDIAPAPRRRWLVPALAAVVALLVGLGSGWLLGTTPPAEEPLATLAAVDGTGAAGRAGLVDRDGVREIVIRVDGVIAPPDSDYLEAWLMSPAGSGLISLGALTRDGGGYQGTFTVPGDLPMDRFPTLDVSAERFDGDATHSRESLLRGTLL